MYTLRPYQEKLVREARAALMEESSVLLQLPTGGGKTIIFCSIAERLLKTYPGMRIGIVMHRQILVGQTVEKMLGVWPSAPIGVACASIGETDVYAQLIIGTVQTIEPRLNEMPPLDLLIVDEAHKMPPLRQGDASQYQSVISTLRKYNPDMRLLGVTATPYRTGHGYIYGSGPCWHRPGAENWFPRLTAQTKISDLQAEGFLVPYRAKEAENIDTELKDVKVRGGEYAESELSKVMSRQAHIESAVRAYQKFGENRRHVVVFAVTIAHAELLRDALLSAGYRAGAIHSQMTKGERDKALYAFKHGHIEFLVNVGVLTEGWDEPHTDLIMFCRPTKSSELYVQMIGRGLRPNPGKTDLLILDLSGNCVSHGDPDSPSVFVPKGASGQPQDREAKGKTCPECSTVARYSALECQCGYIWPVTDYKDVGGDVEARDVAWSPVPVKLVTAEAYPFTSRNSNYMVQLRLGVTYEGSPLTQTINHFLDIEGNASLYGKTKAKKFWEKYCPDEFTRELVPLTVDEFVSRFDELTLPGGVLIKQNGKYANVMGW